MTTISQIDVIATELTGSTLLEVEQDGKSKQITAELAKSFFAGDLSANVLYPQSITINPVVSGTPVVVNLSGTATPYDKQTVVIFLVSAKTSTSINYTIQLYTQGTDGTIVVYQTANLTGNYSDVIPFTIDRNLLADGLFLKITNTGTGTISDMVVRLVSVGV